jgi:hypothetical protein
MCHVDPGERGWGRDRASASKGRESSKVKFRPAPPHTVSISAWTGRRRGGHSAQHLRSRSACDRLILTIGLGLRLRLQLQLQLQARRCSQKVSLASLARRLQSPNAVHALRAGSRSAAVLHPHPTAMCQAPALCPRLQALRRLHAPQPAPQRTLSFRSPSPLIAASVLARGARYQNGSDQWNCVEVAAMQIMSLSLGKWRWHYAATVIAPRLGSAR